MSARERSSSLPWWIAGGVVGVLGVVMLALPVVFTSESSDAEPQACGSPLSTLSRRLDSDLVEDGDVSPGPAVCEQPLTDRGTSGVTTLAVAALLAVTGFPARRWRGLVFPAIVGGVLVWHLAWPVTLAENEIRDHDVRCGSPAMTSFAEIDDLADDEEDLATCATARDNRLARGGLVAVLAAPLVLLSITRREEE